MFLQCFVPDLIEELGNSLKKHGVIPDVLECYPELVIMAHYACSVIVRPGCILTPEEVKLAPSMRWMSNPNKFYTLIMIDPDAPTRTAPTLGQYLHWLVGNIPGCDVVYGDQLAAYIGSRPPPQTDYHRYVFVVYKQLCHLDFDEPYLSADTMNNRSNFSVKNFANKYALGKPVGINFFLSKYNTQ